jgi:hypothetical protein
MLQALQLECVVLVQLAAKGRQTYQGIPSEIQNYLTFSIRLFVVLKTIGNEIDMILTEMNTVSIFR